MHSHNTTSSKPATIVKLKHGEELIRVVCESFSPEGSSMTWHADRAAGAPASAYSVGTRQQNKDNGETAKLRSATVFAIATPKIKNTNFGYSRIDTAASLQTDSFSRLSDEVLANYMSERSTDL